MSSSNPVTDLANELRVIWGAAAIAKVLGLTKRQVFHKVQKGQLKSVRKIGNRLCATKDGLIADVKGGDA